LEIWKYPIHPIHIPTLLISNLSINNIKISTKKPHKPHFDKQKAYFYVIKKQDHITKVSPMEEHFITVKTFTFASDVPIVQTFMEMRGIEIYMKNLTLNRLTYPLGDIEMQVKSSDYESAKEALIEGGFAKPEDFV